MAARGHDGRPDFARNATTRIDLGQCHCRRQTALLFRYAWEADVDENTFRSVAIVDDDEAVRDAFRSLLEAAGHVVESFASAPEFLRSELHHFGCLISDYQMKPVSGLDMIAHLRTAGVNIPALLVTAFPSPSIVARAALLGVRQVLKKPANADELLDFVDASQGWRR